MADTVELQLVRQVLAPPSSSSQAELSPVHTALEVTPV
jgi:hypothetical protein